MHISIPAPYLTPRAYARQLNDGVEAVPDENGKVPEGLVTERAVIEMCKAGDLPVKPRKSGQRYYINVALLTKQALEREY